MHWLTGCVRLYQGNVFEDQDNATNHKKNPRLSLTTLICCGKRKKEKIPKTKHKLLNHIQTKSNKLFGFQTTYSIGFERNPTESVKRWLQCIPMLYTALFSSVNLLCGTL